MKNPQIRVVELAILLLLVAFTWAFYRIMAPFLLNAFLAIIFANICRRPYSRVRTLIGNAPAAAAITVIAVFLLVAVPVGLIGLMVYSEAVGGYAQIVELWPNLGEDLMQIDIGDWLQRAPVVGALIREMPEIELSSVVRNLFETGSDFIVEISRRSFISITSALINVIVILFLMFFLFLDGPRLMQRIHTWVPLPDVYLKQLAENTMRTTGATLISTVIIGMIEGGFGAVLFWIFGLPSPVLWGVIIMILSMVPLIGANLVLTPAGIIVMLSGDLLSGLAIILLGYGGVTITQNLIRPKLLGDRSGLHPALVLLSTIGGIAWLGLIGFLVGPLLVSLALAVWSQFASYYQRQYTGKNSGDRERPRFSSPRPADRRRGSHQRREHRTRRPAGQPAGAPETR